MVMEVSGSVDAENRQITMTAKHGRKSQIFELIYLKDWKGEPTTGEWNKDYGLKVNTDFHIVSTLGNGRYIDYLSRNLIIKTQNGRPTQKWYFHQPSRTIRGRSVNQSIEIHNSGKSNHLQYYSTNSRWW
jgi:hypothetical protein